MTAILSRLQAGSLYGRSTTHPFVEPSSGNFCSARWLKPALPEGVPFLAASLSLVVQREMHKVKGCAMASRTDKKQVNLVLSQEEYDRLVYWAKKEDLTISEYLRQSIELSIRVAVGDYDLPRLEVQRLNQLIDAMAALSSNVGSLEQVVQSGFTTLLGLTRGDAYLLDEGDE